MEAEGWGPEEGDDPEPRRDEGLAGQVRQKLWEAAVRTAAGPEPAGKGEAGKAGCWWEAGGSDDHQHREIPRPSEERSGESAEDEKNSKNQLLLLQEDV